MIRAGYVVAAVVGGTLAMSVSAQAERVYIHRINVETGPNTWSPALEVRRGDRVEVFTVDSGALTRRQVFDPASAIAFVAGVYAIDLDVTPYLYCIGGFPARCPSVSTVG
jgi:hypothetical protein